MGILEKVKLGIRITLWSITSFLFQLMKMSTNKQTLLLMREI